jgi:biotin carboxyl carrier protein
VELLCNRRGDELSVCRGDELIEASIVSEGERLVVMLADRQVGGVVHASWERLVVSYGGRTWAFHRSHGPDAMGASVEVGGGDIEAPMTGTVLDVLCAQGDEVEAGAPLVVVEAMKMEHRLVAPGAATVKSVDVSAGHLVDIGQILVRLELR